MHENFMTCNRYIPLSTINMSLGFYVNIKWQNGVSMRNGKPDSMLIPCL
jgi:hypothetical protein